MSYKEDHVIAELLKSIATSQKRLAAFSEINTAIALHNLDRHNENPIRIVRKIARSDEELADLLELVREEI